MGWLSLIPTEVWTALAAAVAFFAARWGWKRQGKAEAKAEMAVEDVNEAARRRKAAADAREAARERDAARILRKHKRLRDD
jgi:hypothetical protein